MRSDLEIKEDVLDELVWHSNIDESKISVMVENGVVHLFGVLENHAMKVATETAILNVVGIRELIKSNIKIIGTESLKKQHKRAEKIVSNALKSNPNIPDDNIKVIVEDGWVYLSGGVSTYNQRNAAKRMIEKLLCVKGVINNIEVKQDQDLINIKEKVKKSLELKAEIIVKNISVLANGHTVTLVGTVNSIKEKKKAELAAYIVPGVYKIRNKLKVQRYFPDYAPFGFIYK